MLPERAKLLAELLCEIKDTDNYWLPDEVWVPFNQVVRLPFIELAVARCLYNKPDQSIQWQILMTYRDDQYFKGWHLPGGLWKVPAKTYQAGCNDIANCELGISVHYLRMLHTLPWNDHEYGNPLSLLCLSVTSDKVTESETQKFFSLGNLPESMVKHHQDFAERAFSACMRFRSLSDLIDYYEVIKNR